MFEGRARRLCAALLTQTASLAGSSNDEEIYTDELVKDEGGSELVLVLSREVRVIEWHEGIIIGLRYRNYVVLVSSSQSSDHVNEEIDEEVLGGLGYTDTFVDVQQCTVCVCTCVLRAVYMYVQCMNVCMLKLIHG